jgi:hypothetical protein
MYLPDGLATSKTWFYIFVVLFAVLSLPMFAIILAYTNDYIPKEKFVVAGAGFANCIWFRCNEWTIYVFYML